jgi:hypothetical protein
MNRQDENEETNPFMNRQDAKERQDENGIQRMICIERKTAKTPRTPR